MKPKRINLEKNKHFTWLGIHTNEKREKSRVFDIKIYSIEPKWETEGGDTFHSFTCFLFHVPLFFMHPDATVSWRNHEYHVLIYFSYQGFLRRWIARNLVEPQNTKCFIMLRQPISIFNLTQVTQCIEGFALLWFHLWVRRTVCHIHISKNYHCTNNTVKC